MTAFINDADRQAMSAAIAGAATRLAEAFRFAGLDPPAIALDPSNYVNLRRLMRPEHIGHDGESNTTVAGVAIVRKP